MTPLPAKPPQSAVLPNGWTTRDELWIKRELAIADQLKRLHELICTMKRYNVDEELEICEKLIHELQGEKK